ncbi:hypothetical protein [Micromonospora sp. CPCC 205561]|uniref:hypothetical protein n=1 Tax=Micromonospora sp. CPCC 205561 TaxID=3122407 RepID=UPI002FF321A4
MTPDPPSPARPPLPRRTLLGLAPLAAALAVAVTGRPARAAAAPECLADLAAG